MKWEYAPVRYRRVLDGAAQYAPCVPDGETPVHFDSRPPAALRPEAIQPIARETGAKKEVVQHVAYSDTRMLAFPGEMTKF